jgi:CBS domain-containing protein
MSGFGGLSVAAIIATLFFYNIVLAIFNLIPAFPMDGGRVLRAVLAMRLDYGRATDIAVRIGRTTAVLMGLYGLLTGGFFMILIAFFVYGGATEEGRMVQVRTRLRGLTVAQAYSPHTAILQPYDSLEHALRLQLSGQSNFPVTENGELIGFLTEPGLMTALQARPPHASVAQAMLRQVLPVSPHSDLSVVQQRMNSEGLSALPVTENGRVVGVITRRQIANLLRLLAVRPELAASVRSA